MTNDKTSHLSINVVYETLKASDPSQNITKIKQHTCNSTLLYTVKGGYSTTMSAQHYLNNLKRKNKTLKDKFLQNELVS
jgi:hypothetical protein